jgi:hypothetical protein
MNQENYLDTLLKNYNKNYPFNLGVFNNFSEIDIISHYTSIDAIKNIIQTKRLWLSNCQFLNDRKEIQYTIDLINEVYNSTKKKQIFAELLDTLVSTASDIKNMFVLSLSYNNDNLTLWYNYARNEGYNLGFNLTSLIEEFDKSQHGLFGIITHPGCAAGEVTGTVLYDKVVYDKLKQLEYLESILSNYELAIQNETNARNLYNLRILTVHRLLICSLFFKDNAFSPENEFRIIVNIHTGIDKVINFRTYGGIFVPYIEMGVSANNNGRLPIESIRIGPKNNFDIAEKGIALFLETCGYLEFKNIKRSSIPLRY